MFEEYARVLSRWNSRKEDRMLEMAAQKLRGDRVIRGLLHAIRAGDRTARKIIVDRAADLGVEMAAPYFGYLVAYMLELLDYHDSGEGPFRTRKVAIEFALAEVGVPWKVIRHDDGFHLFCGLTHPERIRLWVEQQFQPQHVERVFQDLLDVATGNRDGNRFEREALERIFPEDGKGR